MDHLYGLDALDEVGMLILVVGGGALLLAIILITLLIWSIRAARHAAAVAEPISAVIETRIGTLGEAVRTLDANQNQLAGGLRMISEHQVGAQAKMIEQMERRLEEVQKAMGESLHGSATRTARSLGELQQRLEAIDKAQGRIEKLSGDVLTLQDILANKQTRGAFGEIQLNDIVSKALPPEGYSFQQTLSNGKRVDCLLHMPNPPGPIGVDAKFPLEPYEALRAARTDRDRADALRQLKTAFSVHIKAIAEKYIIEEETADSALMFLPSEAVYAELHASLPDVVRQSHEARVWIVSPTTLMAVLNTMRAVLKDVRMREQAGAIRRELILLGKDVERLGSRVGNLDRHFAQATRDLSEIRISAEKAGTRARRLDAFEFEATDPDVPAALPDRSAP